MSVLWPDGLPLALELPMIVTDLRPLNAGGLHVRIATKHRPLSFFALNF